MQQSKNKILIADDDPGILDALMLFLEDVGYEVEIASNGETINNFENGYPDLLLLDIWLSGWNGKDICRSLKSEEKTRNIPIILISANRETEKIAKEAGADDFITKPFELDNVVAKIEKYLK